MSLQKTKLGSFEALLHRQDDQASWVVLLHGYGASAADLAPFSQVLLSGKAVNWAFIQAPMAIPLGPHMVGYAWFPLDEERIAQRLATGQAARLSGSEPPPEFFAVARELSTALAELAPAQKIVLGGFSQGSMLTLQVACEMQELPLGLVLLSSAVANQRQWRSDLVKLKGTPCFQAHGVYDDVLSVEDARELHTLVKQSGLQAEYYEFDGGHEIPPQIAMRLNDWLITQLQ